MKLFTDVLRDIRKGRAVDEATRKLAAVVQAVAETGKAGSLTLTLTVKPQKDDSGQVVIATSVSHKTPEPGLPDAIFFVDSAGGLHRDDPNQREMFAPAGGDKAPKAQLAAVE